MSFLPIEQLEHLRVGTVDFVSPNEIKISLEIDSPDSVSLNSGTPRSFPRINSYVLINSDTGYLVGQVEWIAVERSPYPKRKGLQDFGLIDLPYPLRKLSINPVGTLRRTASGDSFKFSRGTDAFPSVGDSALLPTDQQLRAIIESGEQRRVLIGESPLANNAKIAVDPDRLFGRHIAVLGNTGSGKSCSVAGLIQWSLDAASTHENKPNARFIVLDPNGEYSRAFAENSKYKAKVLRVESEEDTEHLKVPSWLWNSAEWAAFTQASPRAQLPLLRRALRAMRNEQFDLKQSLELEIKKYLATILTACQHEKSKGSPWQNFPHPKNFFQKVEVWSQSINSYCGKTPVEDGRLDSLSASLQEYIDNRRGQYPRYEANVDEIDQLLNEIESAFQAFGGDELQLLPKSEDVPVPFDGQVLVSYLEALAQETGNEQFVEFLLARIKTMQGDSRISAIADDSDEYVDLTDWLGSYLGSDESNASVTVIDLSLVPNEIIHLVTAVVSRIILEALQRYRRMNGSMLPTVLVAEEAHTFIKRYKEDSDSQDTSQVCCKVFEKIAREGRKFGLGLVVSSQRPSELSPTVLSQCNTFLLHRISNDRDQEQVHRLVPDNMRGLLRELPSLPSRHAILLGWASELPVLVRMRELSLANRPHSDDPDYWNVWSRRDENGDQVNRAVDWRPIVDEWQKGG
ncbi:MULTISPECIES: ATP-binding protein [Marinobacter]|uniref:ATP-binding protein n=1 Tax=Marinobacter TaxID=2742 RepID=UPI001B293F31|nr:DUF87 domain-containing protein [Marinobacter sp.]MBO6812112.1 DUF87 domain-containing protein [Marinobacter sp.]MBO6873640.1 DUF87 domain-containing protein [Marinobacter sp.]